MLRTAISVAALILTAAAAGGCATPALVKYAAEKEFSENVAAHATSAWRDEAGDLVVCVTGWTAKRRRAGDPKPFSFRLTLAPPDMPEEIPGIDEPAPQGPWDPASYIVAKDAIEGSCPDKPDDAREVPVERIAVAESGEWTDSARPPKDLLAPVDLDRAGPVLYSFDHPGEVELATLVYQHETPLPGGARLVRIDLPLEILYPNSMAILVLPLAVVVDVVGILLIAAFCIMSPPDC